MRTRAARLFMRNYTVFSALLILCVASLALYSIRANKEIAAADSWVSHTQQVIIETQGIITGIHQMVASQRGYLLTGEQDFITRYEMAEHKLNGQIEKVEYLLRDNSGQAMRIEALERGAERFAQTLRAAFGSAPVIPDPKLLADKQVILDLRDDIVSTSQSILTEEYALLNTRAAAIEKKTRDYRNTLYIGGAGSALLLLLLNGFLLRAQARRSSAERHLRETEDRLALAIRGSNNGVFDLDLVSDSVYWSPQYQTILGYDSAELPPTQDLFRQLLHPDDAARVMNTFRQYIGENLSEYFDIYRMRHKSGRWVWIQAKGMAIFDDEGKATRFVGTHTDISHLKEYERRLEEEKERAEKANAAKSEFLAHMSHEIRTPLTAISGIAEILIGMEDTLGEKQRKLIHTLASSATSLKDLIADILDFSRIESGEIDMNERRFDLAGLFEQVISITNVKAAEKQLSYTFDYAPLVEETFYGDPARLRQVLINLIGNAIKFTDKGSVEVSAQFEAIEGVEVLAVRVADTGVGIDGQALDIIFEKFRQADTSVSRRYGGTGLGLPISKKLVELMDGRIHVESEKDKGSVFTLYLPVRRQRTGGGAGMSFAAQSVTIGTQKQNDRMKNALDSLAAKILLVEDYEGNIVVLSHLLEEMGYQHDIARTGVEAIERWKTADYSLILMDVQMPEMDGLTATRTIRELEAGESLPETPIIGLTAHAMVADQEKCTASGMNAYLPKPIDEDELKKAIAHYIRKQPGQKDRAA